MAQRMQAKDWSLTPLGRVDRWPPSLLANVISCLGSRLPGFIAWGPELLMLYNDACSQLLGNRHPAALGSPGAEAWPEIWPILGPMLEGALYGGEATWSENIRLAIARDGFAEESWFTFSYGPIPDKNGVGGVFTVVAETTRQVIGERRLKTLRDVVARTSGITDEHAVCETAAAVLRENADDFASAAVYLLTGTDGSEVSVPEGAIALRVAHPGEETPAALLVAGLSPRLTFDDAYRGFLELTREQIGAALASTVALEAARKRAEAVGRPTGAGSRRAFDVAATVVEAVEHTSRDFAERAIELLVTMPCGQFHVDADPARLSNVVASLLANAARYTPRGGQAEIEATREGDDVLLRVRSGGIGIAPELMPHLFNALHGGSVSARSDGSGTEFTVRLRSAPRPARGTPTNL